MQVHDSSSSFNSACDKNITQASSSSSDDVTVTTNGHISPEPTKPMVEGSSSSSSDEAEDQLTLTYCTSLRAKQFDNIEFSESGYNFRSTSYNVSNNVHSMAYRYKVTVPDGSDLTLIAIDTCNGLLTSNATLNLVGEINRLNLHTTPDYINR